VLQLQNHCSLQSSMAHCWRKTHCTRDWRIEWRTAQAPEKTTHPQLEVKREMVRVGVFPGCGKKMKSYTPETFHRLPLRYNDWSLVDQWLIVLNMDIETPIKTLMQRDHRVCSATSSFPKELLTQRTHKEFHWRGMQSLGCGKWLRCILEVKLFAYFSCYMVVHNWCGGGCVTKQSYKPYLHSRKWKMILWVVQVG
jgi:hypothetical protein